MCIHFFDIIIPKVQIAKDKINLVVHYKFYGDMKVKKIMTVEVGHCGLKDSLSQVVSIMRRKDCGVVPIVDLKNVVVGMISDRDACIATVFRNNYASEILAGEVMSKKPISCKRGDDAKQVLKKMRKHRIKRLPVINKTGKLAGIISLADFLRLKKNKSLKKSVLKTLEAISKPEAILLKEI